MDVLTNKELTEIGIAFGGSIIVGIIIQKLVFPFILRFTRKTKWKGDDFVVDTIAPWVIFWFFLGACFLVCPGSCNEQATN